MKNYKTWLKSAAVFQFIMAVMHFISFLDKKQPNNETEKQLFDLMNTYPIYFGAGFHRTIDEVKLPLSVGFSLFCLFSGLINWFLIRKKTPVQTMKGIILINLFVFGINFGLLLAFTYLPPMILSGLIFFFLVLSAIAVFIYPDKARILK